MNKKLLLILVMNTSINAMGVTSEVFNRHYIEKLTNEIEILKKDIQGISGEGSQKKIVNKSIKIKELEEELSRIKNSEQSSNDSNSTAAQGIVPLLTPENEEDNYDLNDYTPETSMILKDMIEDPNLSPSHKKALINTIKGMGASYYAQNDRPSPEKREKITDPQEATQAAATIIESVYENASVMLFPDSEEDNPVAVVLAPAYDYVTQEANPIAAELSVQEDIECFAAQENNLPDSEEVLGKKDNPAAVVLEPASHAADAQKKANPIAAEPSAQKTIEDEESSDYAAFKKDFQDTPANPKDAIEDYIKNLDSISMNDCAAQKIQEKATSDVIDPTVRAVNAKKPAASDSSAKQSEKKSSGSSGSSDSGKSSIAVKEIKQNFLFRLLSNLYNFVTYPFFAVLNKVI